LRKIKSCISGSNKPEYYALIAGLLGIEQPEIFTSPDIQQFYLEEAKYGINMSSPVTRTKVLSILSLFAISSLTPDFLNDFLPKL
jgi:hypothetical protein